MLKAILVSLVFVLSSSLYAESHDSQSRDRGHHPYHFSYPPVYRPVCYPPVYRHSPFFFGGTVISRPVHSSRVQYVEREEIVMVEPAREEMRYVQPVHGIRIDVNGRKFTIIVREGFYEKVLVPARYERRIVMVPVVAPVVEPSFSFGLFFGE